MEQKILDCTLRDGGLVNRFILRMTFVRGLYRKQIYRQALTIWNLDIRHQEALFDRREFGKWKFCQREDLRAVVGDNKTSMKISVHG